MNKIHDNIIRDLLPLYIDKVCSSETERLVEERLQDSEVLREELDKMRTDVRISEETSERYEGEAEAIKRISAFWSRSKWRAFLKGTVLTFSVCCVLLLGYVGLFRWNVVPVSSEVIEISDIGRLEDGKIVYHIALTDGYESNRSRFEMDDRGNFYIVPYRPIIKTKAKVEVAISYYEQLDFENEIYRERYGEGKAIQALYYGKPEDSILVWKQEMQVPAASGKAEAWFAP
ncbi:hypothetical protein V3851_18600 [Paenibacillus sp. M1]|uniref:DUF4179 domain-containing protein n=1 Tax=Paenibacillus haidiansis TaxID=1574488 RepID=A0ABU7VY51_9BACL